MENGKLKIKTDLLGCCATTPPNSGGEWWWTSHLPPNSPQLHDNSSPKLGEVSQSDGEVCQIQIKADPLGLRPLPLP